MAIRALIFDLDDTLVPERPRVEKIMQRICERTGYGNINDMV